MKQKNLERWRKRYPKRAHVFDQVKPVGESSEPAEFNRDRIELSRPPYHVFFEGIEHLSSFKRLRASPWPETTDYIFIEPSAERFLKQLGQEDIPELEDPNCHWLVGLSPEECFAFFYDLFKDPVRIMRLNAFYIFKQTENAQLYRDYFEVVQDECLAARKLLLLDSGFTQDSLIGIQNTIDSGDWIARNPGINQLKDRFKGMPAVVAATGPSLAASLEDLRAVQNKAVILAADASLSILLKAGIRPHFVLCLERDEGSRPFFQAAQNLEGADQVHLVSYPLVPQSVLKEHPGPQWVAYRNYGFFIHLEDQLPRGVISSSASVAHMCVRLADYMGCDPIVLVGQDLAFDPDTLASHAEGVAYEGWDKPKTLEALKASLGDDFLWVPGNLKPEVPTSSLYFCFMKEYSWEATKLSATLINATQGGARIPNIPWKMLSEIAASWTPIHVRPLLYQARKDFNPGQFNFDPYREYCFELSARIDKLLSLVQSMADSLSWNAEASLQVMQLIGKVRRDLLNDFRFLSFIVETAGRDYLNIENRWNELRLDDPKSFEEQARLSVLWLHLVKQVAGQIGRIFEAGSQFKSAAS